MSRQLTGAELLNIPPEQVWSLAEAAQVSNVQSSSMISPLVSSPSSQNLTNVHAVREMNELSQMVNRLEEQRYSYFQDLEYLMDSDDVDNILYNSNTRCGRPFKLPSFPIKAIWCKTVICLMDMESDLPEKLDASVSPLHGMPRYLTAKEDYTFNKVPDAAQTRWRVYSPLRNYVGPEVEEMVEFICAVDGCNRFFRTRDMVVEHVFDFHKLYPPAVFKCNWAECEREDHFGAFYQIETHMQRHKVDRPFECQLEGCDRAYRRLENLRTHMRTHSGEKPYKCKYEFCDRSFTNASDRAKHENRTHSSIKGFPCHIEDCDKLYTDPSSLRKHIINAHGAETYEDHKKDKALERKRKIEQRMIERHILRSISQTRAVTGGPIRIHTSRLSPTLSLSPRSRNAASISPRSSTSTLSSNMSPSQLSPLPVVEAAADSTASRANFSMSRILEDLPRPSPPPTTPMFQFPIRPTPVNPTAVQSFAHMPQLSMASQFPVPNLLSFMGSNPQMINALLMARLQMMKLGPEL